MLFHAWFKAASTLRLLCIYNFGFTTKLCLNFKFRCDLSQAMFLEPCSEFYLATGNLFTTMPYISIVLTSSLWWTFRWNVSQCKRMCLLFKCVTLCGRNKHRTYILMKIQVVVINPSNIATRDQKTKTVITSFLFTVSLIIFSVVFVYLKIPSGNYCHFIKQCACIQYIRKHRQNAIVFS